MEQAVNLNKTVIVDWNDPKPFIYGLLGGFLFDMATHGVDQDFVQRLTAGRSLKQGQWVIFSVLVSLDCDGVAISECGRSCCLSTTSRVPLPPDGFNSDHVFSTFIVDHFPDRRTRVDGSRSACRDDVDPGLHDQRISVPRYTMTLSSQKPDAAAQHAQHLRNTSLISLRPLDRGPHCLGIVTAC